MSLDRSDAQVVEADIESTILDLEIVLRVADRMNVKSTGTPHEHAAQQVVRYLRSGKSELEMALGYLPLMPLEEEAKP